MMIGSLAFLFEFLRFLQTKQKQRELILRAKQIKQLCPTESAALLARTITNPQNPLNITLFDRALLFGTEVSLWLLLQNIGYFLMLGVMVYNVWFPGVRLYRRRTGLFCFRADVREDQPAELPHYEAGILHADLRRSRCSACFWPPTPQRYDLI
ncbi:hypothetical protein NQ318_004258 [Aromia moschata]|uniref:Uncharacterized protein n=1 Tax=Aromia moschata TaxID=1265417 RepID=A0AAV8XR85_9CUCU|nr:hypothetical protein NQ318_004258 [Aromia moschata]